MSRGSLVDEPGVGGQYVEEEEHLHTWRIYDEDGSRGQWIPVRAWKDPLLSDDADAPLEHKGTDAEDALNRLLSKRKDLGRNRYLVLHADDAALSALNDGIVIPTGNVEIFQVRLPWLWRRKEYR